MEGGFFMGTRYTIEKAKELFKENDCKLLEKEYKNSSTPMRYVCKCGNESTVALSDFKRGTRCRDCGNKKAAKNRQNQIIDQKEINAFFKKEKCKLLSEYTSYYAPLKYICSCGKTGETAWYSFKKGRRCGRCSEFRKKKYDIEEVRQIFLSNDCELLQDHYENSLIPVKYRCSCGNESESTLNNFLKGNRCNECGLKKISGSNSWNWIEDREKKRANDLFRKKCGSMVRRCLKAMGETKDDKTFNLLGYTNKELQDHIFNHPNWQSVKDKKWHIDHTFPVKAFLDHDITDLSLINHLENLQPLEGSENQQKSGKYNKKLFLKWLELPK